MKIHTQNINIKLEDIKNVLNAKFPDYKVNHFGSIDLTILKTSNIGANIFLKSNKIEVDGYFPTKGKRIAFVLSVVLLGFVIPIIFYLIFFQRKFSKFEKEVAVIIQKEFGITK
ncbi:MAG: hypothetical protein HY951_04050 [Bacteroidia bacterium]|nr:hypothetical protein [Bacteroidia bacterium]